TRFSRDWSSDVCSSDLAVVVDHDVVADANLVRMSEDDVLAEDDVPAAAPEQHGIERLPEREPQRARNVLSDEQDELVPRERQPEIGRASCRGRVATGVG